jgi:hypothetical protein
MSATILPFIKLSVFTPDTVAAMGKAFDRACAATSQSGEPCVHREIVAERIIALAKAGERDPAALCDHALESLGLPKPDRLSA